MKLQPVERLALEVFGWGLLAVLSFFFHVVGFVVIFILAASKGAMFMFVHSHTKDFPYDSDVTPRYEQLTIPGIDGTFVGTKWTVSLRTNLSANQARRNKGNLG